MRRATPCWGHTSLDQTAIDLSKELISQAGELDTSWWVEDRQEDNPGTGPVRSQLLLMSKRMHAPIRKLTLTTCAAVNACFQDCPRCKKPMSEHVLQFALLCKYPAGSQCFAHTDVEAGVAVSVQLPSPYTGGELMVARAEGRMEDMLAPPSASGAGSSSSMGAEDVVLAQFSKDKDLQCVPMRDWDAVAFDGYWYLHAVRPVTSGLRYVLIMNHENCEKSVSI